MEIKFVSYDGEFPTLCMGTLVLNIDGEQYYFSDFIDKDDHHFRSFWRSGGSVQFDEDWNENISRGAWELTKLFLPDFLKPYGQQLIDIFNENVAYGCCGGCI